MSLRKKGGRGFVIPITVPCFLQTALPIKSFQYSGMYYLPTQTAKIQIGPLECRGKKDINMNGGSCVSLKMQGRPSGYYLLDQNNGTDQQIPTDK